MNAPAAVHVFERAGLGLAPFRFIGAKENRGPIRREIAPGIIQEIGSPGQPMGTCDYCGTGIATEFYLRSADGREFKVGCDCIRKAGDAGLKKAIAPAMRNARNDRADERIAAAKALARFERVDGEPFVRLADGPIADVLRAQPHPQKWAADKGMTRADAVAWLFWNGGRRGRLDAAKIVEKIAAEIDGGGK